MKLQEYLIYRFIDGIYSINRTIYHIGLNRSTTHSLWTQVSWIHSEILRKDNAYQSSVYYHTNIFLFCVLLLVDNAGMAHGDIQYR